MLGVRRNAVSYVAGELQDRIGDVSQRVKNLASDSQKLDGFVSLTQGIVGGFAAVQGITALVGDENEDLQKTMVKLQAAMSALAGIQAVANTLNKDSAALTALSTVKTLGLAAAQGVLAFATGGATAATNAFRIALLATGIGAVIVALVAVAQKMDLFGDSISETTEKLKKQKEAQEALNAKFKEGDNALLDRYKQENDIAKAKLKLNGATNAEIIEQDKKFLLQKKALLELEVGDGNLKAVAELEAVKNEIILNNLDTLQAKKEAKQKALDEAAKLKEKNPDVKKKARGANDELEEQRKADQDLEDYNLKVYNEQLDAEKKFQDEQTRIAKEADDARIKSYLESVQAKESIARDSFSILNDLGELALGEQFRQTAVGKTLALAQIATDTALAISALVRNSEANPLNAATGGLVGIAQFATGIARITANVVKAKSILSGGGTPSGSGGGGSSQSSGQAPSINGFISNPNQKQTGQPPLKVYVTETDISDTQGRVKVIQRNAELI